MRRCQKYLIRSSLLFNREWMQGLGCTSAVCGSHSAPTARTQTQMQTVELAQLTCATRAGPSAVPLLLAERRPPLLSSFSRVKRDGWINARSERPNKLHMEPDFRFRFSIHAGVRKANVSYRNGQVEAKGALYRTRLFFFYSFTLALCLVCQLRRSNNIKERAFCFAYSTSVFACTSVSYHSRTASSRASVPVPVFFFPPSR